MLDQGGVLPSRKVLGQQSDGPAATAELKVHYSAEASATTRDDRKQAGLCSYRTVRGVEAASMRSLYCMVHGIGIQYGPKYRLLSRGWAVSSGAAVAQLHTRRARQGTHTHPADLDGAIQLCVVASRGSSNRIRLPFAIDTAAVGSAAGEL